MKRNLASWISWTAVIGFGITALFFMSWPAEAACNFFWISAPPSVLEGHGKVTVSVKRAGEEEPSSVRVRTANGTAMAGQDYEPIDRRITFTSGTSQDIDIPLFDDDIEEGDETFTVHLSDGSPCGGFPPDYADPQTITIRNDDPNPPVRSGPRAFNFSRSPTPSPMPPVSPSPIPSRTIEVSPSPSEAPEVTEPSEPPEPAGAADLEEESGSAVPIIVAIALVVAAGAGGGLWWLRRRQSAA